MKRVLLALFFGLFAFNAPVIANDKATLDIVGSKININAPDDFYDLSKFSPDVYNLFKGFLKNDMTELQSMYIYVDDYRKIKARLEPDLSINMMIHSPKNLMKIKTSKKLFKIHKDSIKKSMLKDNYKDIELEVNKIRDRMTDSLNNEFSNKGKVTDAYIKMPSGVLREKFIDNEQAMAHIDLANIKVGDNANDLNKKISTITSSIVLLVNHRVIYMYLTKPFENLDDIIWVKKQSKKWVQSILDRN